MKKKDLILIGAALLIAALIYAANLIGQSSRTTVKIYVDGELYETVPISEERTVTIDRGDGRINVVKVDGHGVCMESSTCANQLCVNQGTLKGGDSAVLLDNYIICLPNGVTVELCDDEG